MGIARTLHGGRTALIAIAMASGIAGCSDPGSTHGAVIDDGMRYVDPLTHFFVSPAGELCFRTKPNYPQVIYETRYRTWCMYPQTVDRVEAVSNDITRINEVHLWCRRAYPQCAHSLSEPGWIANSISASTVDYRKERDALEDLVDLMGGKTRFAPPPGVEASGGTLP